MAGTIDSSVEAGRTNCAVAGRWCAALHFINLACLTIMSVSLDFTALVTALLTVFGLLLVCKLGVLSRFRWWKDLKVLIGWCSILPDYYKLRKITG